ncbi:Long-chain fatty alcohol dehydrogenase family protein [Perilla frutescens var. frutescens]|nr:Long-chain fatty alcohol dehydrogenase family protein [Perilla frutescens var. frutescens]
MVKNRVKKLSSGEVEALGALCDTFLPSIDAVHVPQHLNQSQSVLQFYHTSASMAGTPPLIAEIIGGKVEHPKMPLARLAIMLLSTWIGTFILCGRKSLSPKFPYFLKFSEISFHKREEILLSWSTSYFSLLRILYGALKFFILLTFFTQVDEKKENLSWKAIGYCGPDPGFQTRKPDQEEAPTEEEMFGPLHKRIINFSQSKQTALHKLHTSGFPVSELPSHSTTIKRLNPTFVVQCDAVVVGSGSGGGVVAGVLAKAGYKVLVLEKGSYVARSNLSLLEGQAMDQMYLRNGLLATNNMNVLLLAGSTVGGGSTINWSASIRTPQHVRKEWSEKHELRLFESKVYDQALDVVCRKMGVQSEFDEEGFHNAVLRKGCKNLGYDVENIPRNATSDHYCGWCCFGCKDGRKKGTAETWLLDLVDSKNGAILAECEAAKVIMEHKKGRKRAVGVAFAFRNEGGREEIGVVEARVTVTACGALCTPELLRRSGLTNPNIGRNLHIHPVVMGWGYFNDHSWPEAEKRSYEGGIMTAMSKVTANFDTSGYGAVIQTPALHPGMFSAVMPWTSGSDMKNRMLKYSRTAHVFALARDKGSGWIASETDIGYELDRYDLESLSSGMERVLRILAAAGAEEIGTHHKNGKVLRVKEASEEEFERFVKEESGRALENMAAPVCSAHQMGSCRMGVDPRVSAVSPKGETWEVKGLFVADSSVFPTALGVNPMVTIQAISYCTAQSLLEALANNNNNTVSL